MDVIYCILSDALRYTDIIWVLRAHAAVTQYCRCWLLFSLYVIFFNRPVIVIDVSVVPMPNEFSEFAFIFAIFRSRRFCVRENLVFH